MYFITYVIFLIALHLLAATLLYVIHVKKEKLLAKMEMEQAARDCYKDLTPQWPSVWPDVPGDKTGGGESGKS